METNRIRLSTLIAATAAVVCFEFIARWAGAATPSQALLFTGIARLSAIAALLFITLKMETSLGPIGLIPSKMMAGIRRGILWSLGFAGLAAVSFTACYLAGMNPLTFFKAPLPQAPIDIWIYFLVGAGLAPIAEEIFFRGVLYGYLRRWGPAAAVLGSTLLFVAAHPNLQQLPIPQLVGGVVFAVAYEIEENLMVPIVIHAAGNFALFSLALIN